MIKIKFNDTTRRINASLNKSGNVITLNGNIPLDTSGFIAYSQNGAMLGNYSKYTTIYRQLENGVQFSNDGSIWVEPTRDITVSVVWNDSDNADGLRPSEISLVVNGETITLTEVDNWQKVYYNIKESEDIVISSAEQVFKYDITINGHSVEYYHEYINPLPSLEDRVSDLETATIELYEMIEG